MGHSDGRAASEAVDAPPPFVSVIIPTYNCAPYLSDSIDSVLRQTGVTTEILVVDDGSTDQTPEVAERYGSRITYLRHIHQRGPSAARNTGLQHASGEWIAFQDADDLWLPDKLSTQLAALQRYPEARLVFSDALVFNDREVVRESLCGQRLKPWCQNHPTAISDQYYGNVYAELLGRNCVCTITVVAHHRVMTKVGRFDERLTIGEDYDLWLKITRNHPVVYVDRVVSQYRLRGNGLSGDQEIRSLRWLAAQTAVREEHLRSHRVPLQYQETLREILSDNCWQLGWRSFREERYTDARTYFLKGVHYRPFRFRTWLFWISSFLPSRMIRAVRSIRQVVRMGQTTSPALSAEESSIPAIK